MKQWIYEQGNVIGSFTCEDVGLYKEISCEIQERPAKIRRLYAASGFSSHYLGIPNPQGKLLKKLSKKLLPHGISCVVSSEGERELWNAWRGEVDGVTVEDALIRQEGELLLLSLPPEEALRFPEWEANFQEQEYHNVIRMLVQLTLDGKLPTNEIENRRDKYEKDEIFVGIIDPQLPSDAASSAGECTGNEVQGR